MNKYIYPFTLTTTFVQFLIIFYASKISIYEVGIYTFINSILVVLIPTATFEGTNHYISKLITKNELETWSKSTNTILTIVLISIGTCLFLYSNLLALSLILLSCLNLYIHWSLALEEPELRLKEGYNNIFKKNSFINQLLFRFSLQFFLIIILGISYQNNLLLKFFILIEILIFSRLSFIKIGVIINLTKFKLPSIKYFLNIFLDRIERSILIFVVGLISGIDTLGNLQLGLTISKSFQVLTKPFIRLEYVNLYSKIFLKNTLILSFFSYIVYLLFPLIFLLIENYFQLFKANLESFVFILICLYSGNKNSKELIQGIYLVFGNLKKNMKFKLFLIVINLFIMIIQIILNDILPLSLFLIILPFIISDIFFTLNELKVCLKINNSR